MNKSLLSTLSNISLHKQVLLLAIPMVLSNITVPLLGLVDAAVIGHLEHSWYLGGVALGGTMVSVTFWLLGFLRMATTGLTAQAYGAKCKEKLALVGMQGMLMAMIFALIFLIFHQPIARGIFALSDASEQVKLYGLQYFSIRAWSAPAALGNFVILGWLLGTQNAKGPMWIVVVSNLVNILLDVVFVLGLDWKVEGAALASVIADYSALSLGLFFVWRTWCRLELPSPLQHRAGVTQGLARFIKLNRDIFLRSLCLQAAFSFMTFQGASFGDDTVAANAVLMSFLMIISYGMDGFAYAMEAMVGKAIGAKNREALSETLIGTTFWSLVITMILTLVFWLLGHNLIALITSIDIVQQEAARYLPWLIAMPLVSMWCFLLDGIFIGATKGREMRNSMFFASSAFFMAFFTFEHMGNHALWIAMLSFMAMRGVGLAVLFFHQWRTNTFLA